MKKVDFSLILVVNDMEAYKGFLENVKTQNGVIYEITPVYNIGNKKFESAREALAFGAKTATGKYLIFLHQDIRFETEDVLLTLLKYLESIPDFGVIGIAGTPKELVNGKRIILSTIKHGLYRESVGTTITKPTRVQTVDECFFIQSREYYNKVQFSPKEGWHLYAVEQCLRAEQDGLINYVVPADIWHLSNGKSLDPNYVIQLSMLCKEYENKYDYINTTVKKWKTKGFLSKIYRAYYYCKQIIKRKLVR